MSIRGGFVEKTNFKNLSTCCVELSLDLIGPNLSSAIYTLGSHLLIEMEISILFSLLQLTTHGADYLYSIVSEHFKCGSLIKIRKISEF